MLAFFLSLPLLCCLFSPAPSLARQNEGDPSFTLSMDPVLQEVPPDIEAQQPANIYDLLVCYGLMSDEMIFVYKDGSARAEAEVSLDKTFEGGDRTEGSASYTFEGRYDSSNKRLTGDIKLSERREGYSGVAVGDIPENELTLEFKGTLDCRFVDDKVMKGKITGVEDYHEILKGETNTLTEVAESNRKLTLAVVLEKEDSGVINGEQEADKKEDGSKIPGPGSWWEWLTGTVVAGAIAAGISLISTVFGSTPPPPPLTDFGMPPPPPVDTAEGTLDLPPSPHEPLQEVSDYTLVQTARNIVDDVADGAEYISDKLKWVYEGATNPDKWKDALQNGEDLHEQAIALQDALGKKAAETIAKDIPEYVREAVRDPSKPFKDLEEFKKEAARLVAEGIVIPILKDPWGTVKSILALEFLEGAMDWRNPLPVRLAQYAVFALNTIGLVEGASGLKNWALGSGEKVLVGAGDDAARAAAARIPRVAGPRSAYRAISAEAGAEMNQAWTRMGAEAEAKVQNWNRLRKTRDSAGKIEALLEVQRDPLAVQALNTRQKAVIERYVRDLGKIQKSALADARQAIANQFGVDITQVHVVNATNPKFTVKAGMDLDYTFRINKPGHVLVEDSASSSGYQWVKKPGAGPVDVPGTKAQGVFDKTFFERAGRPGGTTPTQLSEELRSVSVDRWSPEAFSSDPRDLPRVMKGQRPVQVETTTHTIEYKAQTHFARADELAATGCREEAMVERWHGIRETTKGFNNQVSQRASFIRGQKGAAGLAGVENKIAELDGTVKEVNRMIAGRASPMEIDSFLRTRNTTAEDLNREVAELYYKLTKLR